MVSESLNRALELTRTLVTAVQAGDWQFASDLVEERSPLIMGLTADQSDDSLATIRAIQEMDASVMTEARSAHAAMSTEFSDAKQRIAAAGLYQTTGQLR
ncbi:flagellar protein FliT [Trinickia sp.]|uniref:flagellar protein FliT n=1 Tax=Trinickia sp. TaxID=2571163 RepID=UPI003F7F0A56